MQNTLAMILAGGVGSRLNILVRMRAKPAVPFGGIYRIIDFAMSNVMNSGLSRVAVLTQYKPLSLMGHIGDGSAWDLSGRTREVKILPPRTGEDDSDWYKGTADAVRQNLDFIESRSSEQVLILSGDHVYHMDYREMVRFHKSIGAKVTVAMMTVPWEHTSQFGIGILDSEGRIVDWEEKPEQAKSNLASMGIYVFDTDYLMHALKTTTETDFGHHILPKALTDRELYGYVFNGYWRDVGTVQAYWEAHQDMLDPSSELDPGTWGIVTNMENGAPPYDLPPARITPDATISRSAISCGCDIRGKVVNSVLSPGVVVEEGAVVEDSIIFHAGRVKSGAKVSKVVADKNVIFGNGSVVGNPDATSINQDFPKHLVSGISLIGKGAEIPDRAVVGGNCIVYPLVSVSDWPGLILQDGETLRPAG